MSKLKQFCSIFSQKSGLFSQMYLVKELKISQFSILVVFSKCSYLSGTVCYFYIKPEETGLAMHYISLFTIKK